MAIGVSRMMDLSGLDVFCKIDKEFNNNFDYSYKSNLLNEMVASGRLGQKSGQGFYKYKGRKSYEDLTKLSKLSNIVTKCQKNGEQQPNLANIPNEDIVKMCLYPVVNECFRCVL